MSTGQLSERSEPPEPAEPLNTVYATGSQRKIAFAKLDTGEEPAKTFHSSLSEDDQARFDALFVWICDSGTIKNDQKFHPNVGQIQCGQKGGVKTFVVSEFKIHSGPGYRIMAVLEKSTYVLTHGCKKPKRSQFASEVTRAERFYCEDRARRLVAATKKGS